MMSLADAIIEEQIDQVQLLLRSGTPVNVLDEYGFTPLVEAAIVDNIQIAKILIEYGANVSLQDATGGSPLQWAAENNNLALAKLLLEKGANPNTYTFAGQPALVMPLLRQQQEMKKLFLKFGAHLEFAQDYINAKMLGHMYELVGTADIIAPNKQFVELDFEGFMLEFSLAMIAESVAQFKNHFASREWRRYSQFTQMIIEVISRAAQLIKYQQYRIDIDKHRPEIDLLIQQEPLVIPIGYEGHAITFIKIGNILVKCDRREDSRLFDNVFLYQINNTQVMTVDFIRNLIYQKKSHEFVNQQLPALLNLTPITEIKVAAQISGNCSWANVEACIPALFFIFFSRTPDFDKNISRYKSISLNFFKQWREWNKDRALNLCIQSLKHANPVRQACKAEILAAILYQSCREDNALNETRIEDILAVFADPRYKHILLNYVKVYCYEDHSDEGQQFMRILKKHNVPLR